MYDKSLIDKSTSNPNKLESLMFLYKNRKTATMLLNQNFSILWANQSAINVFPSSKLTEGMHMLLTKKQESLLFTELKENEFASRKSDLVPFFSLRLDFQIFDDNENSIDTIIVCILKKDDTNDNTENSKNLLPVYMKSLRNSIFYVYSSTQMMEKFTKNSSENYGHLVYENLKDYFDVCYKQSYQMSRITTIMSVYYSYQHNLRHYSPKLTNLGEYIRNMCESISLLMKGKNFKFSIGTDIMLAEITSNDLAFAILSIIRNAFQYGNEENQVNLKISKSFNTAIIQISDTGIGIEKNDIDSIFMPQPKIDTTNDNMGISLFLSKLIIMDHGGTIAVKSKINVGTTFIINIPLTNNIFSNLPLNQETANYQEDKFSPVYIILSDLGSNS